jgi:tetratricopeptide (TPR) repeat protein
MLPRFLAKASAAAIFSSFLTILGLADPLWAQDSSRAKAHALVDAAIQMTDSTQALKLLWQATDIDPSLNEPYIYLALYYNSREDFGKVVEVYKKFVVHAPNEVSAYLNIGEAYMSFQPPRLDDALPFYKKAHELDPHSSFAAMRMGEIYAHQGNREEALRFLKEAAADKAKNPAIASEAERELRQLGPA